MTNRKTPPDIAIGNAELHYFLKSYDPVMPPSDASLMALEAMIFARLDDHAEDVAPMEVGIFNRGMLAAACLSLMLVIGAAHILSVADNSSDDTVYAAAANPTLFALADEDQVSTPTVTSLGDDDE